MRRKGIVFSTICASALLLYICHGQRNPWETIDGEGLPPSHQTEYALHFISPNVGFLGAANFEGIPAESFTTDRKAIIYRTEDGGRTWAPFTFGKGAVVQVESFESFIFCLIKVDEAGEYYQTESEIWKSDNNGRTWDKIHRTTYPEYIRKIMFEDENVIFAVIGKQSGGFSEPFVEKSIDGGQSWQELGPLNITNYNHIVQYASGFAYLSHNSVWYYNVTDRTTKELLQHDGYGSKVMTHDNKGNLWILDMVGDRMHLSSIDSEGVVSNRVLSRDVTVGLPKSLHVYENSVSVLVSGESSIFGVSHRFHHSSDAGVTWTEEDVPFPLIVKPLAYFREDLVWAGGYPGTIQFRKP